MVRRAFGSDVYSRACAPMLAMVVCPPDGLCPQPSLDLASFTIEIRAARASSGVLTGLPNARRTGRGPIGVITDMSKPYLSTPVMLADAISVAFEKALQQSTMASAWSAFM